MYYDSITSRRSRLSILRYQWQLLYAHSTGKIIGMGKRTVAIEMFCKYPCSRCYAYIVKVRNIQSIVCNQLTNWIEDNFFFTKKKFKKQFSVSVLSKWYTTRTSFANAKFTFSPNNQQKKFFFQSWTRRSMWLVTSQSTILYFLQADFPDFFFPFRTDPKNHWERKIK